ncbi:MAG: S-layer homology domain-containing protein [Clostridiaceae bacterium]|nr:S-layer homology domain-containing protein [Clostridiaceae bacterium]
MKKRTLSVLIIITLFIALFPFNVLASQAIQLDDIPDKQPGDVLTISGTTTLKEVTLTIFRPDKSVLYVQTLKGPEFSKTITLSEDKNIVPEGTYTVQVGIGSEVVIKTFEVKKKSGGGDPGGNPGGDPGSGSGGSGGGSVAEPSVTLVDGKATITLKPVSSNGTARATISKNTLDNAFSMAKQDADGIRTVVIELSKVEGAGYYSLELPSSYLHDKGANFRIEISTPVAALEAPGNMFTAGTLGGASNIEIILGTASQAGINEELKQRIGSRPVIEITAKAGDKTINPDVSATVIIPYSLTAEEKDMPELLEVYEINEQGAAALAGARYDSSTGQMIFTVNRFNKYALTYYKKTFNDLQNHEWARKYIEFMASKGIIKGTSDTTYSPQNNITRADFMVLLVRTLGLTGEPDSNFDDVKPDKYYYKEIGIAKQLGLTAGVGDNKFNPEENISRQDMMLMAARALAKIGKITLSGTRDDLQQFNDASMVSEYAVQGVASLIKEGIIQGSDNKINPLGTATRAEVAVIMYRIYHKYLP